MKSLRRLLPCLIIWFSLCNLAVGQEMHKALLIGVSRYDTGTGWDNLHAYNDLACVKRALIARGFPESSISTVGDSMCTKDVILSAIRTKLLDEVQPGMQVYLHYSGHGQSLQDTNGDEADGFDEALVPCNAGSRFIRGVYEGENHISDDELNILFLSIRRKLGPRGSLFFSVDACHSGGISRGMKPVLTRGSRIPIADPAYRPSKPEAETSSFEMPEEDRADLAPFTLMTASRPYQLAVEDPEKQSGAFSLALATVLLRHPEPLNYQQLFEMVRMEMVMYDQDPTLEGDKTSLVFGSGLKSIPTYYPLSRKISDSIFELNAGSLAGFLPGTPVNIFKGIPGDTATSNFTGKALVMQSTAFTASLKAEQGLPKGNSQGLWVLPDKILGNTQHLDMELKVRSPSVSAALLRRVPHYPLLNLRQETGSLYVLSDSLNLEGYRLCISDPSGRIMHQHLWRNKPDSAQLETWIRDLEEKAWFWRMSDNLFKTSLSSPEIKPRIQIIHKRKTNRDIRVAEKPFVLGDTILFRVINQGRIPCYYTIINIPSEKIPYVCIPEAGENPEDYYLKAYSEDTIQKPFILTEPEGKETYILVCSSEPLDLRAQVMQRPEQTRSDQGNEGNWNPLSEAVPASGITRGGRKPMKISTHSGMINTTSKQ